MNGKKLLFTALVLVYESLLGDYGFCQYAVQNSVFSNGGGIITDSTEFSIGANTGQALIGKTDDDQYIVQSGFWYQSPHFITGMDRQYSNEIPAQFVLDQNYPNPFNPYTTIRFGIPVAANVTIELYNIIGQKIACLFEGKKAPGYYQVKVDAGNLASGIYLYTVRAKNYSGVKKMVVIR